MAEAKDDRSPAKLEYSSTRPDTRRTVWLPIIALLASVSTGYELYGLVITGVLGRVTSPIEAIGLLGALILFAGSIVAWSVQGVGAITIVVGCVMLWPFYAPAMSITLKHWRGVELTDLIAALIAPALLMATTVRSVIYLLMSRSE